jgi:hypothetical protein
MGSLARVPPLSKGTPLSCHKFEQPDRSRSDVPRVGSPALSDGDPVISKAQHGNARNVISATRSSCARLAPGPPSSRVARSTKNVERGEALQRFETVDLCPRVHCHQARFRVL